jgi:poly(beta-D-mannuronate) lyase
MTMNRRTFLLTSLVPLVRTAERTVATPAELTAAIGAAKPGGVITMRDGTWRDLNLQFTGEGRESQPITLRAQTTGKVLLTGTSRLQIFGRYLTVEGLVFQDGAGPREVISFRTSPKTLARFCRLTRCVVRGYSSADKTQDSKWVSLYGSDNRVDHCYFAGKTNLGQTMVVWLDPAAPENRHLIDHNHFGPRPPLGMNGGESIRVGDSSTSMLTSKTTVESNRFESCDGEVEIISNKSCENVYRGNRFEHCEGTLTLRHGNRCLVEGNVFLGEGKKNTGGIRIIGEDHRVVGNYLADLTGDGARAAIAVVKGIVNSPLFGYFQVKRAVVERNTVVNCAHPIVIAVQAKGATLPPENCTFRNNVVIAKGGPIVQILDPNSSITWKENEFYGGEVGVASLQTKTVKPIVIPLPAAPAAGPGFEI